LDSVGDVIGLLEDAGKRFDGLTAFRIEGSEKELSYGNLWLAAINTGSRLSAMGIRAAERVAILSENRPGWAIAYFGIMAAGAIPVFLDTRLKAEELAYLVNDSGAAGIFFSERYLPLIDGLRESCGQLRLFISVEKEQEGGELLTSAEQKSAGATSEKRGAPLAETAAIIYTSGTTGLPKGVELTHANLLFEVQAFSLILPVRPGDSILSFLPLNHVFELICGLLGPLHCGATITYLKDSRTECLPQAFAKIKPTVTTVVPLLANLMCAHILEGVKRKTFIKRLLFYTSLSLSAFFRLFGLDMGKKLFRGVHQRFGGALRCFICGGAPLEKEVARKLDLMGIRILEGYGLTETSPTISVNTFQDNRVGSVGKPLPGVEVRIMTEHPTDTVGEILTKGPHVMKGYFHDHERTRRAIQDGWFHTGDLGYLDRDGFLYVTGRLKNVIVTSVGKKVQPEEVENVLLRNPFIREVCVVGRKISEGLRRGGEEVYAVVVPDLVRIRERYGEITEELLWKIVSEAVKKSSDELAGYKKITGFEIWKKELPRTSTRKVRRGDILNNIGHKTSHQNVIRR
jgi:long-chain acyl-CoA synthetase